MLLGISTTFSTELIHLQLLIANSNWRYLSLGNRKGAFDLLGPTIYFLSNSCQTARKELGIKGSIKAACISIITNTFFIKIFLGLTLSLMKRVFPWSTIFRWDLESNSHEIIPRNANFRDYEFFFRKQQIGFIILRLPGKLFLMIFTAWIVHNSLLFPFMKETYNLCSWT